MKKRILLLIIAGVCVVHLHATELLNLLEGKYDAKVMTVADMDEVMRRDGDEVIGRYKLEWENKQPLFRHSFLADCYLVDTQTLYIIRS